MQALQVALVLRIVESLQILRMKGPGAEILGVFRTILFLWDVLYKIKNSRVSFVPDPNKTIDLLQESTSLGKIDGQNWLAKSYFGDTHIIPGQKTLPHGQSTWLTVPQEVGSYRVFTNQCKVSVPSTFALVYESGFLTFKAASPFYRRWKISKGTFQMLPNTTQHSAGWCTAGLRDLRIFDRTLFLETIVTTVWCPVFFWKFTVKFHTTFILLMLRNMGVQSGSPESESSGFLVATLRQGIPMVQRAVGVPAGMWKWRHGVEFWRT